MTGSPAVYKNRKRVFDVKKLLSLALAAALAVTCLSGCSGSGGTAPSTGAPQTSTPESGAPETPAANKQDKGKIEKKAEKKVESKPKKRRFGFLKDVRAEMKRVTWPTKKDVLRWSVVVVAALLFFGVYVALLDNVIITPVLVGISSLGA